MPIKTQGDLPVKEILERENIFVMDEKRAMHQDIRPIHILILNLMPLKEDTELELMRSLSNTPLQVDITLIRTLSHESRHTRPEHLERFYSSFEQIRHRNAHPLTFFSCILMVQCSFSKKSAAQS